MNKEKLIKAVTESTGLQKKDVEAATESIFATIIDALKNGDQVKIAGFGAFEVRDRVARKGRNPQTGEEIEIAASKAPAFKAGKALKDAVKE
ncbi:HU family DNA-binding protein [Paenibacillus xylanexedens]|uniref:HU family DNA-binding protein n=1 Tax=Paenibacillus xylanexedens TaxID=528191 RepID=UPI0011A1AE9F|nr:HU family DNA-binding protein [Paenibacillus xylanexedens]